MKDISKQQVLSWIVAHADDTELMDKLNKLTFPFTSKYKRATDGYLNNKKNANHYGEVSLD